jgi:hypothetical protein
VKTNVASTSIGVYHAIYKEGKIGRQHSIILSAIAQNPSRDYSLQELCAITHMTINAVSGRCTELKAARRLELAQKRSCSITKRTVVPVRLPRKQLDLL